MRLPIARGRVMQGAPVLSRWRHRRPDEQPIAADMTPASDGASVEEVYHDAALQFLNVQYSGNEVLDARTYQAFSIGSTVLPLTFALLNLSTRDVPAQASWFLGAALGVYLVVLICALRVSFVREFEYRPDIAILAEYTETLQGQPLGGQTMKVWVAREYLESRKTSASWSSRDAGSGSHVDAVRRRLLSGDRGPANGCAVKRGHLKGRRPSMECASGRSEEPCGASCQRTIGTAPF